MYSVLKILQKKFLLQAVFILFLVLLLIFWGLNYFGNREKNKKEAAPGRFDSLQIDKDEHILGNINEAKVVIIEYSDTECPFCKSFHYKFKQQVYNFYFKEVALVYRHFPLTTYPKSRKEAEALECATEQKGNDMFWQYLEEIYRITPSRNGLDPNMLPETAKKFNLDLPAFNRCLTDGKFSEKVSASKIAAAKLGVSEAPSVIIWNKDTNEKKLISGANGRFLEVKTIIEQILTSKD